MAYGGSSISQIFWLLVALGAISSFAGVFALGLMEVAAWLVTEFVLRTNHDPYLPFSWSVLAPRLTWLYAALSGALSTGVLAPWFIRRLSQAASRHVIWGAFLGMLAAILNTVILTLISIGTFSYVDGSFETSNADWIVRRLFPTILIIGLPPTIFGAAAGAWAAKCFRKALLTRSEPSSTIGNTTQTSA